MTSTRIAVVSGLAGLMLAGCGAQRAEDQGALTAAECAPIQGQLDASASATALAGRYRLIMVSGNGGRTVGTVSLQPHAEDMREVRVAGSVDPNSSMPLFGMAQIALDSVGAVTMGDLASSDPSRPGVVVIQSTGARTSITLRFGSEANRRDMQRIEGGFTALQVQRIAGSGFYGTWSSGSGDVRDRGMSGYFCALKQ